MKLGLIARADKTGLGYQTRDFYRHMKPDRTLVVDISHLNGNEQHLDWYPDAMYSYGFPQEESINRFLDGLDIIFTAESAYNYRLYSRARELGVKTACQYNFEFFDWFIYNYPTPDILIAPTRWGFDQVDAFCQERGIVHIYLHCPVDRTEIPYSQRSQARRFLHVVGKEAAHDRNGTEALLKSLDHVKTDIEVVVSCQNQTYRDQIAAEWDFEKRLTFKNGTENRSDLYRDCDVLVLPRRYGGNCLPMNEALSAGLPVLMPNLSPNSDLLPPAWLYSAYKLGQFTPRIPIDIYDVAPKTLAKHIDSMVGLDESEMISHSQKADEIADRISWETLLPAYQSLLCS